MSDAPKIFSLKTRAAFAPEPDAAAPAPVVVCAKSLHILEAAINQVKLGDLSGVGVIGVVHGYPQVMRAASLEFKDLAMLSLGVGLLGDMIANEIDDHLNPTSLGADGEDAS